LSVQGRNARLGDVDGVVGRPGADLPETAVQTHSSQLGSEVRERIGGIVRVIAKVGNRASIDDQVVSGWVSETDQNVTGGKIGQGGACVKGTACHAGQQGDQSYFFFEHNFWLKGVLFSQFNAQSINFGPPLFSQIQAMNTQFEDNFSGFGDLVHRE
jgi:hypothetical protein